MSSILSAESTASQRGLKPKFQIGSINGPKNFKPTESVFHSSDIPDEKKALKKQTKATVKKDVLGEGQTGWNTSTFVNEAMCKRQMRVLAAYDKPISKYNYRAEVLPKNPEQLPLRKNKFGVTSDKSTTHAGAMIVANRTSEFPINPKLDGKEAWDHSVEVQKQVWGSKLQKMEETSRLNSETKKATLSDYTSLETRFKQERTKEKRAKAEAEKRQSHYMEFQKVDIDSPEWIESARKQMAEADFAAEASVPIPRKIKKKKQTPELNQSSIDTVNRMCKSTRYNFASIGERFGESHEPQLGDRDEDPVDLLSSLPNNYDGTQWVKKAPKEKAGDF